jgi:hypothetical protein
MLRSSRLMDEFKVGELFNKFYGELTLKRKVPDTGEVYLNIIFKYFNKLTLAFSIRLRFSLPRSFFFFFLPRSYMFY